MKSFTLSAIAALAALLPTSLAQTHTDCFPLNTTGCPSMQALGSNATFIFTTTGIPSNDKIWRKQNQGKIDWEEKQGATFTIERSGDSPMVQSRFYMLFGRLESEALDEIDWEFLGSNTTHALTNYFGKGNTSSFDRGKEFPMDAPQDEFHNYTIDWTKERIQWWLDGKMLRELVPAQALNGFNYPQTPMNVRLGMWAGGDARNNAAGVVEWAGGETNFDQGPFTMSVQQVYAKDYTEAKEYSWDGMDKSGSWEKVKVVKGGPSDPSPVLKEIQSPSGVRNRWAALPQSAKIGIIAGALGVFVLLLCVMAFCCVKQRRAGRREHAALLAEERKEAAELNTYKMQMQGGKFAMGSRGFRSKA
ncbi:concanavalin A-like lectin/glucanase domain-containing protein [Ampelomyces quisqualis]|uniref:chitinase n=1 Tax=Ampelomyces quisqualis TaxID=50730 RepID=A0A6A5QJJ2_AMPQU|nr:concanavalin A-like lectin/glucanase domain-containing protein [Ampelomyces quisqualis]